MKKILPLIIPVVFLLVHCGSGTGTGAGGGAGSGSSILLNLQISNPDPNSAGTAKAVVMSPSELAQSKATVTQASLTTCTLTVTATGMSTLTQSFSVSSSASTITTSLSVSAGSSRTFDIDCSDGSATTNNIAVGYNGSATADISETTSSVSINPKFKNLISDASDVVHYVRFNQENATQTKLSIGFGNALTEAQKAALQVIIELDTAGTRTSLGSIDKDQTTGLKATTAVPYIIVAGGTTQLLGFFYDANQAKQMKLSCLWTTNDSGNTEAVCTFGITQFKNIIDSDEQGQFAAIGSLTGASPWDEVPNGAKYALYNLSPNTNTTTDTLTANSSACLSSRSGETCTSGFCSGNGLCVPVPNVLSGSVTNFVGPDPGTTTAGSTDGTGNAARFNSPRGLCITENGAELYIMDITNNVIRRAVIATQVVALFAGAVGVPGTTDGTGTDARFNGPSNCVIDSSGTNMYVTDSGAHTIRKIVLATTAVTTLAGTAGTAGNVNATGTAAAFDTPVGIAINSSGNTLYVGEQTNNDIRKIVIDTGAVTLFAGSAAGTAGNVDGTGSAAMFNFPIGLAIDSTDTNLYVGDTGNNAVRKVVIATQEVSTKFTTSASFVKVDPTDTYLYATTFQLGTHLILRMTLSGSASNSTTIAGQSGVTGDTNGTGTSALFNNPNGLIFNSTGTTLYISDTTNNKIRQIQ